MLIQSISMRNFIHSFYICKLLWWCIILLIHWKLPHIFRGPLGIIFCHITTLIKWLCGLMVWPLFRKLGRGYLINSFYKNLLIKGSHTQNNGHTIFYKHCDLTKGVGTELKCADPDISYTTNEVSQGYKFYLWLHFNTPKNLARRNNKTIKKIKTLSMSIFSWLHFPNSYFSKF